MSDPPLILYVEDNASNRILVSRVLEAAGFQFRAVPDGWTALDYLAAHTPDLILMDLHLPEWDGYALTRRLREMPQLAGTPVVALTASVMPLDRERAMAAGCAGFIEKPISVDQLPQQIRGFLPGSASP